MHINPVVKELAPDAFFGIRKVKDFIEFGAINLSNLGLAMQEKLKFTDLGLVKMDSSFNLLSDIGKRPQMAEFKQNKLAKLTLSGDIFKHSTEARSLNSHTIGLVINKNPNEHFYSSRPQIIILDSLGNKTKEMQEVHNKVINDFIKKEFPDAEVIINSEPQQMDNSLSCLNWTLANLEVAKENLGRTDILPKLPKSGDMDAILAKQKIISQNYRAKF